MRDAIRTGPGAVLGAVAIVFAGTASADMSWLDDVDSGEYQCLAAAIFNGKGNPDEATAPDDMERIAWVLKNRTASDEFPGSFCELAENLEKSSPWIAANGSELVRAVMRAEVGSEAYERAKKALEAFRLDVGTFRYAQIAAYKLLRGWYEEDSTDGSTEIVVETVTEPS